jgi:hypothetical protein
MMLFLLASCLRPWFSLIKFSRTFFSIGIESESDQFTVVGNIGHGCELSLVEVEVGFCWVVSVHVDGIHRDGGRANRLVRIRPDRSSIRGGYHLQSLNQF